MLSSFIEICDNEGYIKPTVYQCIYSIIDCRHEGVVLDLVRKHGMQFVARSTSASGFLHGALTSGQTEGMRFAESNIMSMDARQHDTVKHHEAIRFLDKILNSHGLTKIEASLRWLAFHSKLTLEDAIIFGSSKIAQIKQNVAAVEKGPLPEDVVTALNGIWEAVQIT
jgi:aflatoxin B1 aldehyde reductase